MISAQVTGFAWMTIDGGGYCGGDSQSPAYRETQMRWMQVALTLPIMRQHGQRDHTVFSWYGPDQEKLLQDLVRLRTSLQPYLQAELTKLSKAGRPFNRPLNYDFPTDAMTWALAEKGLGSQNNGGGGGGGGGGGSDSSGGAAAVNTAVGPAMGDFVQVMPCGQAQQWQLAPVDIHNTSTGAPSTLTLRNQQQQQQKLCLDSATLSTQCNYRRQCGAAVWTCQDDAPPAHTWSHRSDGTLRNTRDAGFDGTQGGAEGGGEHCLELDSKSRFPIIAGCKRNTSNQRWVFNSNGTISNGANPSQCLSSAPPAAVVGLDQYMVGDGMMAAPVLAAGARERLVYFPLGADWVHHYTGQKYPGGTTSMVPAPLSNFPLFKKTAVVVA
jgi:hypothetical protein